LAELQAAASCLVAGSVPAQVVDAAGQGLSKAAALAADRAVVVVRAADRAEVSVDRVEVAAAQEVPRAVVSQAVPAARQVVPAARLAEPLTRATEHKPVVAGAVPVVVGVVVEWGQAVRVADRAVDPAVDAEDVVAAAWEPAAGSPAAPGCPSMAVGPAVPERSAAAAARGLAGRGLAGQAVAWALAEQLATRAVPN
jgi:hypothetical protein